jgi:hypothetical protein
LALGTLVLHVDRYFGGTGIFSESKVLLYEFIRGESCKGVIINKKLDNTYRLGGPNGLKH